MREIFIDTNVIFDLLIENEPDTSFANALFECAIRNDIVLNICPFSLATVYYMLRKRLSHKSVLYDLGWLSKLTKSLPVNETIINQAMKSDFRDFEDAIQYFCALQATGCEAIITRNSKDFKLSAIPVFSPALFLGKEKFHKPH